MPDVVCYTSFTYSYLARACLLARTLKAAHPDWQLWALLVDKPPPGEPRPEALSCFDRLIDADEIAIPRFRSWIFKHNVVEACTAVKGAMLRHLLALGAERIFYLDPDIAVFHGLDDLQARLDTASIVLVPHQIAPNDKLAAATDNELAALRYGIYNLGFLGVRNDAAARSFPAWWDEMLRNACYEAVEHGLFTDQRYCDLVPALFDGVYVDRDPGNNVASWNLSRRTLRFDKDGTLLVNDRPLGFYHFTKIPGAGDAMTERYAGANVEVHEVVSWYRRCLQSGHDPRIAAWPWHYGRFANGDPVPHGARIAFRGSPDLLASYDDPFAVGPGSFHERLGHQHHEGSVATPMDPA